MAVLLFIVAVAISYLGSKIARVPYWRMLYIVPLVWIAGYGSIWIAQRLFWVGLVAEALLIVLGYLLYKARTSST